MVVIEFSHKNSYVGHEMQLVIRNRYTTREIDLPEQYNSNAKGGYERRGRLMRFVQRVRPSLFWSDEIISFANKLNFHINLKKAHREWLRKRALRQKYWYYDNPELIS